MFYLPAIFQMIITSNDGLINVIGSFFVPTNKAFYWLSGMIDWLSIPLITNCRPLNWWAGQMSKTKQNLKHFFHLLHKKLVIIIWMAIYVIDFYFLLEIIANFVLSVLWLSLVLSLVHFKCVFIRNVMQDMNYFKLERWCAFLVLTINTFSLSKLRYEKFIQEKLAVMVTNEHFLSIKYV